jgi:hypothetical protein
MQEVRPCAKRAALLSVDQAYRPWWRQSAWRTSTSLYSTNDSLRIRRPMAASSPCSRKPPRRRPRRQGSAGPPCRPPPDQAAPAGGRFASSPPRTGAHGSSATHRPPQHGPAAPTTRLPSSGIVEEERWDGASTSRYARPSARQCPLRGRPYDRPAFSAPREHSAGRGAPPGPPLARRGQTSAGAGRSKESRASRRTG